MHWRRAGDYERAAETIVGIVLHGCGVEVSGIRNQ